MLRSLAKKIPGLRPIYRSCRKVLHDSIVSKRITELIIGLEEPFISNSNSNLIVSLTSFPARIDTVWIAIETIFRQDYRPWKVVLVLSTEEFPDKKLPKEINKQIERGLEILWTDKNTRSYKKLIPTRKAYPEAYIVTVDDDIFYEPWRLSQLVEESKIYPNAVIGHRGWEVKKSDGGLAPYVSWPQASRSTSSERTFITTGGGTLYPPDLPNYPLLLDEDKAIELCPTADDIWFWATCLKWQIPSVCLGNNFIHTIEFETPFASLSAVNCTNRQNDVQLKNVVDYFNLWDVIN